MKSVSESGQKLGSGREVLTEMANQRKAGNEDEVARLSRLYIALRRAEAVGEAVGFDPVAVSAPTYTEQEKEELFGSAKNSEELRAAVGNRIRDKALASPLALPMPTYSLTRGVPLIKDAQGDLTEDVASEIFEYLPGLSQPRFCLAGLLLGVGRPVRACRLVGFTVGGAISEQTANMYGIPVPTDDDMLDITRRLEGSVSAWQQEQINQRVADYCIEHDMLPVAAPPMSGTRSNGLAEITVTLADRGLVEEICAYEKDGKSLGREQVHYLQVLFSNGDVQTRRWDEPTYEIDADGELVQNGTEPRFDAVPDYRMMNYLALTAQELSPVTELLGIGRFVGDGHGLVFSSPMSVDAQMDAAMDAEAVLLSDEEATRRTRAFNRRRLLEYQFRATELSEDNEVLFLTKGTLKTLSKSRAAQAAIRFEDTFAAIQLELALSQSDKVRAVQLASSLAAWTARYQPAYKLLQRIAEAENEVALIVRGDQIKVNSAKAHGSLVLGQAVPEFGPLLAIGTYLKGKAGDFVYVDGDSGTELISYEVNGVYSLLSADHADLYAGRHKPVQYRVSGNSQVLQLADERVAGPLAHMLDSQIAGVAEMLTTTTGIADLVSEEEGYRRRWLEAREAAIEAGEDVESESETYSELDLLKEALRSGLIRMTSEGMDLMTQGKPVPAGNVRMPEAIRSRLDALVAARVKRMLRSMGLVLNGYHHTTGENSVSLMRAIWGLESWGVHENDGPHSAEERAAFTSRTAPEYPFLDNSTCYTPKVVTDLVSADDDGDITWAIACVIMLPNGRMIKLVMFGRYPMVDAPVLWALPVGVPTPWDARSADEERVFEAVLTSLDPVIPMYADLFADEPVLCNSERLVRLSDIGAKAGQAEQKKKFVGPVDLKACMQTIRRKWSLNSTGSLTRRLERFAVVIAAARRALHTGQFDFGEGLVEIHRPTWETALDEYMERADRLKDLLELQLTGFKYDTELYAPPVVQLGEADPFGFTSSRDVALAIPLNYHRVVKAIRVTGKRYHRDIRDTCLQELSGKAVPFDSMGKEARILNFVLAGTRDGRGGAVRTVVKALVSVKTEIQPYLMTLQTRLDQFATDAGLTAYRPSNEVREEARTVMLALDMWRTYWREIMTHRQALIESFEEVEEGYKAAQTWVGHAAEAIRFKMRKVADNVSDEALVLAIYNFWKKGFESLQESVASNRITQEEASIRGNNAASVMALIEGRISDVFEAGRVEVQVTDKANACYVFTKGADLPLRVGSVIEFAEIYKSDDDLVVARYVHPGTDKEMIYTLFPCTGKGGMKDIPYGERMVAVKLTSRRAVLRW